MRINVSYPAAHFGDSAMDLDAFVDEVVGQSCVGSGVGSWMLSFSGRESGTWRDREYETNMSIADVEHNLKARHADIDWAVTAMPFDNEPEAA